MTNKIVLSKKKIEISTRVLGLLCLFFVVNKQIFKLPSIPLSQDILFFVAIAGIILLSISLNLQVKVGDENPNFFKRNTPLIFGFTIAFLLSVFFLYNTI